MKDKKEFGLFIQAKRKAKGYSQAEFASMLYVTESAVSKWERGVTYPDITLISDICKFLDISEHEFLTATNDLEYRKMKKDVNRFYRMSNTYFYICVICYSLAILTCFICNLAVSHTLSWFFVVLFSVTTAFTLFPSISRFTEKYKFLFVTGSFVVSLMLLLLVCNIFTGGGSWLLIALFSILLSYGIIIVPTLVKKYNLPTFIKEKRGFWCVSLDVLLLLLLLLVIAISTSGSWFGITAASIFFGYIIIIIPICIKNFNVPKVVKKYAGLFIVAAYYVFSILFSLVLKICLEDIPLLATISFVSYLFVFIFLIVFVANKKYFLSKCDSYNKYFRTASALFIYNVFIILSVVLFGSPLSINLGDWSSRFIDSNIAFMLIVFVVFLMLVFLVLGVIKFLEKDEGKK